MGPALGHQLQHGSETLWGGGLGRGRGGGGGGKKKINKKRRKKRPYCKQDHFTKLSLKVLLEVYCF